MQSIRNHRKATWFSAMSVLAMLLALFAVGTEGRERIFPNGLWSSGSAPNQGSDLPLRHAVGGASITVKSIYSDPEQTLLGYEVSGSDELGSFVTIGDARLLLPDGAVLPFAFNAQSGPGAPGTLVFPGLPQGLIQTTLELDRLQFDKAALGSRVQFFLKVDTREAYAQSAMWTTDQVSSESPVHLRLTSVSRTPTLVVLRGQFAGMTTEDIQSIRRIQASLTYGDGTQTELESARWDFGDGHADVILRFPDGKPGPASLTIALIPREDAPSNIGAFGTHRLAIELR